MEEVVKLIFGVALIAYIALSAGLLIVSRQTIRSLRESQKLAAVAEKVGERLLGERDDEIKSLKARLRRIADECVESRATTHTVKWEANV